MENKIERPSWGADAIADLFGVSPHTVRYWIKVDAPEKAVLRQTLDGKRWYAFASEVADWLKRPESKAHNDVTD